MHNTALRTTCRWLLWAEIGLTVSAVGLAVAAIVFGPTGVSEASEGVEFASTVLIICIPLLVGGALGLVVVQRGSPAWRLGAGAVLVAPVALAVGCLFGPLGETEASLEVVEAVPEETARSLDRMWTMLTLAYGLTFLAMVVAAVAGVLILLLGRMAPRLPAAPPSAS